jgi:hypothetical protein
MKLTRISLVLGVFFLSSTFLKSQNALSFDGTNDFVQTTYPGITGSSDRTIEAWVYVDDNAPSSNLCILDYGLNAVGSRNTFSVSGSRGLTYISGGTNTNISSSTTNIIPNGQWVHVAFVLDNGTGYLYKNGVQVGTGSLSGVNTPTTGVNLRIGQRVVGGSIPFNGKIDEVRFWNYAKSAAQILAGMNNTACGNTTGLVAYYNFNHGIAGGNNATVTTLIDYASTNNGTLNNFALSGSSSNWVGGKSLTSASSDSVAVVDSLCDGYKYFMGPFTYTQPGVYIDTLSNSSGCDSIIHLTLHPKSTDATASYVNQSFEANNANPGVTYQWVNCSSWGILVGETNQQFFPTNNDEYAVFVTENNCMDTSECMSLLYAYLDESPWNGLNIYPNPANDRLRITIEESVGDLDLSIYDLNGRLVLNQTLKGLTNTINIEYLDAGLYIVKLTNSETSFGYKVQVK